VDGRPSGDYPRDANARIFRHFGWDLAAACHRPPNGGSHTAWWLFSTRRDEGWSGDQWPTDRKITPQ
jgi:hypothetical protein